MGMGPLDAYRREMLASEAGISDWRRPYTEEEMMGGLPSICKHCKDAGCRRCEGDFESDIYDDDEAITREENAYERYIFQN